MTRQEDSMDVWLVTMTGVYDHGPCGMFTDEAAAQAHADALEKSSDHHHDYRIDRLTVDEPLWPALRHGRFSSLTDGTYIRATPEQEQARRADDGRPGRAVVGYQHSTTVQDRPDGDSVLWTGTEFPDQFRHGTDEWDPTDKWTSGG